MKIFKIQFLFLALLIAGCEQKQEENAAKVLIKTPVEVTGIKLDSFVMSRTFKGVTHYLTSGDIISPIAGYITKVYVRIGDKIIKGTSLFEIETKESFVLKDKNYLDDPELKNVGKRVISAADFGVITVVRGEENEYVQEGTYLGSFAAPDMFAFLIEVPAELDSSIKIGKACTIRLPNGKVIKGKIANTLAIADSSSQTESYLIVPDQKMMMPARLQLKITFIDYEKNKAQSVQKEALLSDETQSEFWVMKLINDTTAIKVPVKIGMQNENYAEILEPKFSSKDRIITKGNYGLSDTAYVTVKSNPNGKQ